MEKIFDGKVAIVTGGSFGIGRATAVAFALRGAKVIIADLIEDKEHETIKLIKAVGREGIFIQCDVSQNSHVKAMGNAILQHYYWKKRQPGFAR